MSLMKSLILIMSFTFVLISNSYIGAAESQADTAKVRPGDSEQVSKDQQKQEYQNSIDKQLAELRERLRTLKVKAEKAGENAKLNFLHRLPPLFCRGAFYFKFRKVGPLTRALDRGYGSFSSNRKS